MPTATRRRRGRAKIGHRCARHTQPLRAIAGAALVAATVDPGTTLARRAAGSEETAMGQPHLVIVGGGLAGLSAGCYARRNGFRTTIVEHNLALGGVCTAWQRGAYTVDGCIHWLTGGAFERLYAELDIVPSVPLRTLETWATYRDLAGGWEVVFSRDLDALTARLTELAPEDAVELARMRRAAEALVALAPRIDAAELVSMADTMRAFWQVRGTFGSVVHFRQPVGAWAREHLRSERLRRVLTQVVGESVPAFFLLMVLGYLERGYLSRPRGGTAAFRDALVETYRRLGGEALLHATVDEVLVEDGRARGVRLADGTMMPADAVLSTSSAPETVLRLLGGRYEAEATRRRLREWTLFDPIVLASFGVAAPYGQSPSLLRLDRMAPLDSGGRSLDGVTVRVCNDDPALAPPGHCVIQAFLPTNYQWWATRGSRYGAEKDAVAERTIAALEPQFPELRARVGMIDVATPLTYWSMARSWRGAYEGWIPQHEGLFAHVDKKLAGLDGFYMAGQWVEPGGGVPTAIMSGRQAIQLLCRDAGRPFVAR
jgi:phytoene dehydrogenase-like protein